MVTKGPWWTEAAGTLAAAILVGAGVFALFVGMGITTHLLFSAVLTPKASPLSVVLTAVAAMLVVTSAVLIAYASGRRLTGLPRWLRVRAVRRAASATGGAGAASPTGRP